MARLAIQRIVGGSPLADRFGFGGVVLVALDVGTSGPRLINYDEQWPQASMPIRHGRNPAKNGRT